MCSSGCVGYMPILADFTAALPTVTNHLTCRTRSGLSAPQSWMQGAPKKKFEKGQFERRARMEPDKLEALLFQFFEREVHSTLLQRFHGQSPSAAIRQRISISSCMPACVTMKQMRKSCLAGTVDTAEACGADGPACCIFEGGLAKDCQTEQIWTPCSAVGAAEPVQDQHSCRRAVICVLMRPHTFAVRDVDGSIYTGFHIILSTQSQMTVEQRKLQQEIGSS